MIASEPVGFGPRLHADLERGEAVAALGVYDVFSAAIAAERGEALFLSGFSFAASHYGLPDIGFIAWPEIVDLVGRIRTVVPDRHLVVDIDDGYGDDEVAAHVARLLERAGASAVVLEDQARPRRCGHMDGKLLRDLDDHLRRLERVVEASGDMLVVARTDASAPEEILRRCVAFAGVGADVVLADGLRDLDMLVELRTATGKPLVFNQLAGGKSPQASLKELGGRGVALVLYSTAMLFAAQRAMEDSVDELLAGGGRLDAIGRTVVLDDCQAVVERNHAISAARPHTH